MAHTLIVGHPLISDEEIENLGYFDSLIDPRPVHSDTRDIPLLLVEQKFFTSKRLVRNGTPPELHKIYEDDELDIVEWKRRKPWPTVVTIIIGAATEEIRDNILMDIGCEECKDEAGAGERTFG